MTDMLSPAPQPFKENRPPGSARALSGFSLLGVSGPDAAAFLQAQLMNDVAALAPAQWQWNGWLSAKGRVIALFALLRRSADDFILVLPDHPADALLPRLQRYVFRSKLRLQVIDSLRAAADWSGPPAADVAPDRLPDPDSPEPCLDWSGAGVRRQLRLLAADSPALLPADAVADAAWLAADLAHGLPRLPMEPPEAWTPHMLSLQRLNALSLKKGCYPGQEIVARTHYLGQSRRGLARVAGGGIAAGAAIVDADGNALGSVACATPDGCEGLAVLALESLGAGGLIGGEPIGFPPLLDGLQRPA